MGGGGASTSRLRFYPRAGNKVLNMPGQDVHASCILAGHLQDLAGHV